ncbi:MAG: DUF3570 domain-containing protein [Sandaracinus sp.]|nr:DUF3570 domain-containing protein [Sandaracinus sp.]MCB9612197.1 DUF3570 domain-containing protein [Sandaracinus sp.]MCB9623066.1 DUF3570 domain-containing protein [Sandaracinus sp.]MCB9634832.1 DUF3570 domain-containing protein [Sandaracinus sp.]
MQLSQQRSFRGLLRGGVAALVVFGFASSGSAQVTASTTATYYRENGGGLNHQAITPSVRVGGVIRDVVSIRLGWDADVVSGASVAVVDAPGGDVDAITSATKWSDFRNNVSGGLGIRGEFTSLDVTYTWGRESDYRSHAFTITGRAELFDRNTTLELGYGRGFDQVCSLSQPRAQEPVDRQRLPSSDGCFDADDRESLDLSLQTFRAGWTQAWAPIFATQLTLSAQVLNGFQGNPYRAVWLGRAAAQENHPENRVRYSANLGARLWIQPLRGALQLSGRVYRDTWDLLSVTAEIAWEQNLWDGMRVRLRGRYYNQTGTHFFSDDYGRAPRGQYFTGDRELSPMSSWVMGGRIRYDLPAGDDGKVGLFDGFAIVAVFDFLKFDFRKFHYGRREVPNDTGMLATLGLEAEF